MHYVHVCEHTIHKYVYVYNVYVCVCACVARLLAQSVNAELKLPAS